LCGRYTLAATTDDLVEAFEVPPPAFELTPRYNVAPGQLAPVVAEDRSGRRVGLLTWGLVPQWVEEPGRGIVNARSESVADKPSFREAFERRRCLVPADGFYEWRREGSTKVPYWIHAPGREVLAFAGVWETWSRAGSEPRHTFAILTTEASDDVAAIHDRMPVLVARADRGLWLARDTAPAALREILRPAPAGSLTSHVVSTRVNRTAEDDEALIEPAR